MNLIRKGIQLYKINKLTYNTENIEKFKNFKSVIEGYNSDETNIIYIIDNDFNETNFYIGVVFDKFKEFQKESVIYNAEILKRKILSHFKGSELEKISNEDIFKLNKKIYELNGRINCIENYIYKNSQNLEDVESKVFDDYKKYFSKILRIKKYEDVQKNLDFTIDKIITGFSNNKFIIFNIIDKKEKDVYICTYIIGESRSLINGIIEDFKEKVENIEYEELDFNEISKKEFLNYSMFNPLKKEHFIKVKTEDFINLIGFPNNDMVGITLQEEISFGLNIPKRNFDKDSIKLAYLMQNRIKTTKEIKLNIEDLSKHIFITGVTGSGKTTTCKKILLESKLPFIVIEPAKTEYRELLYSKNEDIVVFTAGESISPLYINPFVLQKNETIEGRIGMIKGALLSTFNLDAAIGEIIEQTMFEIYKKKGFFTDNIKNKSYPTLLDLINSIEEVVETFKFSNELKQNYIGAIKSRLNIYNMGSKKNMYSTISIDFEEIIEKKVIFELDDIKDPNEKNFLIAIILLNINQAIKNKYKENNKKYNHITLIEEAHRFLSNTNINKEGITIFTDMLAEVRKYGESLIIVDQIPNKLVNEVIKNTNTKIVHKIFSEDDKKVVGSSMNLTNINHLNYLSRLNPGESIIFSEGWDNPILAKIEKYEINDFEYNDKGIENKIKNNIYIKKIYIKKILYDYSKIEIRERFFINNILEIKKIIKELINNKINIIDCDIENINIQNLNNIILDFFNILEEYYFYKLPINKMFKNLYKFNNNIHEIIILISHLYTDVYRKESI